MFSRYRVFVCVWYTAFCRHCVAINHVKGALRRIGLLCAQFEMAMIVAEKVSKPYDSKGHTLKVDAVHADSCRRDAILPWRRCVALLHVVSSIFV